MSEVHTPPPYAVARPSLYEYLDSAVTRPLTLMVAPAGSGKSVLLSQWIAMRRDLNVAWIDVVGADSDAVHFARRLLHSLSAIRPSLKKLIQLVRIGEGALGAPLLDALINEFESLPPSVIILDDLHLLTNESLQTDLADLVSQFPPHIHAIFSSRVDLPITSLRKRLHLNVPELRSEQLKFSRSESELAVAAVRMAIQRRRPVGTTVHSDRGSQFRSRRFVIELHRHGVVGSISGSAPRRLSGAWTLGRLSCVGVGDDGILFAAANRRGAQGYAAGR